MTRLTIGMPTCDDFEGVYFTVEALRLYHRPLIEDCEILVVDDRPGGKEGQAVAGYLKSVANARYVPNATPLGAAGAKNAVFDLAQAPYVLCMDCHVLLFPGALEALAKHFEADPDTGDLIHGVLVYASHKNVSTQMDPVWGGHMLGKWGFDERGADPAGKPFEIVMHGTGLMASRKDAWLGFHPAFRGWGGQAGPLHEKYRRAGHKVLCLPALRWVHRFGRPRGIPFKISYRDIAWNYFVGRAENGAGTADVVEQFTQWIPKEELMALASKAEAEVKQDATLPKVSCFMATYNRLPHGQWLLEEAIESFLRQDYPNKELVILNDAPGQEIRFDHPDVRVVNAPERYPSLGAKFNAAVELCSGDILCEFDDDDLYLRHFLSSYVELLGTHDVLSPVGHWHVGRGDNWIYSPKRNLVLRGLFTRDIWERGGKFDGDRKVEFDFLARVRAAGGSVHIPLIGPEECSFCYRWVMTDSYHYSLQDYAQVGTLPVQSGTFTLEPHWQKDYGVWAHKVAIDPHVHLPRLRELSAWPKQKPQVPARLDRSMCTPDRREFLKQFITPETRTIMETGSWLGGSAEFFLKAAPQAHVICCDTWLGGRLAYTGPQRRHVATLYETFLATMWGARRRLTPIRNSALVGMNLVAQTGLHPDLLYFDDDHTYEAVRSRLELAVRIFPEAQLTGDDYHFPTVRRAVNEMAEAKGWTVQRDRYAWALVKEPKGD